MSSNIRGRAVKVVNASSDLILHVGWEHPSRARYIRVSSKVLVFKSPVFKAMLQGKFLEGQLHLNETDPPVLDLPDDNSGHMLTLCRILHPGTNPDYYASSTHLVRLGMLCDKYGCQQYVKHWLYCRLGHERHASPKSPKEIAEILQAAFFFDDPELFYVYTKKAINSIQWTEDCPAFQEGLGEPFPDEVAPALSNLSNNYAGLLRDRCQEVLVKYLAVRYPVTRGGGATLRIPEPCDGQVKSTKKFITAIQALGLWSGSPYIHEYVSLNTALRTILKVTTTNVPQCKDHPMFSVCVPDWVKLVAQMDRAFRAETHGLCLVCLKEGKYWAGASSCFQRTVAQRIR